MNSLLSFLNTLMKIPGVIRLFNYLKKSKYKRRIPRFVKTPPSDSKFIENKLNLTFEDFNTIFEFQDNSVDLLFGKPEYPTIFSQMKSESISNFDELSYVITVNENGDIDFQYEGRKLSIDIQINSNWLSINLVHNFDQIFGLGEKGGSLNKMGEKWIFWNVDNPGFEPDSDPLYKSYPIMILSSPSSWIALIIDYPGYQEWDLRKRTTNHLYIEDRNIYAKILFARTPKELMREIIKHLGSFPLPPIWTLGYHQCRWSYFPGSKVLEVAETFRDKKIPADVIYLDIDYMDEFRCFTWDEKNYGDPIELINKLHDLGFKVVTMIDPGIKVDPDYFVYQQGIENNYFCKIDGENYVDPVWPGDCVFPDFFNTEVRKWFGSLYENLVSYGVDGFWNDMNEPSTFTLRGTMADEVIHDLDGNKIAHRTLHNKYGQMMIKASYDGLSKLYNNKRVFLLSRSGYLGSQKYGWIWTGDNKANWGHLRLSLRKLINSGLSGHFASGADIGGFRNNPSPELYARWIQLGLFYPLMRTHTSTFSKDQEPWSFGDEVEEISRQVINMRYKLIPYIYTWMWYASKYGVPLIRPMWMEFPDDPACFDKTIQERQFFFGPEMLVAPVTSKRLNKWLVYLPKGEWINFFTGEVYDGGSLLSIEIGLSDILIFVRSGSIIPMYETVDTNYELTSKSGIEYLRFGSDCSGKVYLDDGTTLNYQSGNYGFYAIDDNLNIELIDGQGFD